MEDKDRNNLHFLLYAPQDVLSDWYRTASDDDLKYAHSLLYMAKLELIDAAYTEGRMHEAESVLHKIFQGA